MKNIYYSRGVHVVDAPDCEDTESEDNTAKTPVSDHIVVDGIGSIAECRNVKELSEKVNLRFAFDKSACNSLKIWHAFCFNYIIEGIYVLYLF